MKHRSGGNASSWALKVAPTTGQGPRDAHGGKTHLRARNTRFEDGKLTSESFKGELEGSAYDQLVKQTQQYVANQTAQFLRAFSLFLPFSTKRRSDRD